MAVPAGTLIASMISTKRMTPVLGDHFVSPTGTGTWSQAQDVTTPCAPATAFANAVADDYCWFRSGTYHPAPSTGNTPSEPAYQPANSGTLGHPIVFAGYPGEEVIIDAAASVGSSGQLNDDCLGSVFHDYIVFDGFKITGAGGVAMGRVYIYHANGCQVSNCAFDGGTTIQTTTDNCEGLRLDNAEDPLVQNCTFTNYRQVSDWENTAAIKMYYVTRPIVEHCEFTHCTATIYDKTHQVSPIYRYNFVYDCFSGVNASCSSHASTNGQVYGNLFVNCRFVEIGVSGDAVEVTGSWLVYNNTIYRTYMTGTTEAPIGISYNDVGVRSFNNIVIGRGTDYNGANVRYSHSLLLESDYNQYGTTAFHFEAFTTYYSSLAALQASTSLVGGGHPDTHSLVSDPLFANPSGTLSEKADFALAAGSPCLGTGKAGADMGCAVTMVGVQ